MIAWSRLGRAVTASARALPRDSRGASAVEFAIVCLPFLLMLMAIVQLGIYLLTQSFLDAGVIQTADSLVNSYYSNAAPATLTPTSLKALVVSKGGGMIQNNADLSVEIRKLTSLGSAAVPVGNVVEANAAGDILALRAQVSVTCFVPGLANLAVRSSAVIRRQSL